MFRKETLLLSTHVCLGRRHCYQCMYVFNFRGLADRFPMCLLHWSVPAFHYICRPVKKHTGKCDCLNACFPKTQRGNRPKTYEPKKGPILGDSEMEPNRLFHFVVPRFVEPVWYPKIGTNICDAVTHFSITGHNYIFTFIYTNI